MNSETVTVLDGFCLFVLIVALARGAFIGMIRESFSIGSVAISCIALRLGNAPLATWLTEITGGEIGTGAAPFISGAFILIATVALVGFAGRYLKRGAQAVGLGWADRLGGGVLGLAEGALVATLVVMGATLVLGRDHDSIDKSRSVAAVDVLQEYVSTNYPDQLDRLPTVAAPPRPFK